MKKKFLLFIIFLTIFSVNCNKDNNINIKKFEQKYNLKSYYNASYLFENDTTYYNKKAKELYSNYLSIKTKSDYNDFIQLFLTYFSDSSNIQYINNDTLKKFIGYYYKITNKKINHQ